MDPSGKGPIGGVWGAEGRQELNWANSPLRPIRFVTVRDWLHITVHHVAVFKGMWYHPTLRCFVQHVGHNTTNWIFLSKHLIAQCYLGAFILNFFHSLFLHHRKDAMHGTYVHMNAQRVEEMQTNYIGYFTANLERAVDKYWCSLDADIATLSGNHYHYLHTQRVGATFAHVYIVFPPHIVHKERPLLLCLSFFRPSSLYNTINWCYCNTPRAARLQRLLPAGLLPRVFPELKGDGWLWNSKTDWERCLFEVGKMD